MGDKNVIWGGKEFFVIFFVIIFRRFDIKLIRYEGVYILDWLRYVL